MRCLYEVSYLHCLQRWFNDINTHELVGFVLNIAGASKNARRFDLKREMWRIKWLDLPHMLGDGCKDL